MAGRLSNVVGFDDAPFPHHHRGDVTLVATVCSRTRLDGILRTKVRRDGRNSTDRMIEAVASSPFHGHLQAVLLQGIAVAGFNVVDIHRLSDALELPVLVVARRAPDLTAIRRALERSGSGWQRKWRLIEQAGPMEALRGVFVQRANLPTAQAQRLLAATTVHGRIPEPLRMAHLIAGGMTTGVSRGRA